MCEWFVFLGLCVLCWYRAVFKHVHRTCSIPPVSVLPLQRLLKLVNDDHDGEFEGAFNFVNAVIGSAMLIVESDVFRHDMWRVQIPKFRATLCQQFCKFVALHESQEAKASAKKAANKKSLNQESAEVSRQADNVKCKAGAVLGILRGNWPLPATSSPCLSGGQRWTAARNVIAVKMLRISCTLLCCSINFPHVTRGINNT